MQIANKIHAANRRVKARWEELRRLTEAAQRIKRNGGECPAHEAEIRDIAKDIART